MGKTPAFQFYPNDWNRDMEEHPLEIQGAWIVLLCKLWWSETRGEATKSLSEWARILREKTKKTEKILNFLKEKHIANIEFLDNQNITIISRRMVKDFKISQIRRRVGKLGGNPGLKKIEENNKNLVNQTDNQNVQSPSPTPYNNPPTPLSGGNGHKKKMRFPEGFKLTGPLKEYAVKNNILPTKVDELFSAFRDNHIAKGSKMLDWDRAWYTWVRNAPEFSKWAVKPPEQRKVIVE